MKMTNSLLEISLTNSCDVKSSPVFECGGPLEVCLPPLQQQQQQQQLNREQNSILNVCELILCYEQVDECHLNGHSFYVLLEPFACSSFDSHLITCIHKRLQSFCTTSPLRHRNVCFLWATILAKCLHNFSNMCPWPLQRIEPLILCHIRYANCLCLVENRFDLIDNCRHVNPSVYNRKHLLSTSISTPKTITKTGS